MAPTDAPPPHPLPRSALAARWVAHHADALWRFALARVRDPHTAEDLVQQTFADALRAERGFRGDASERTWLLAILRRRIADHRRRAGRERAASVASFTPKGRWAGPPPRLPSDGDAVRDLLDRCLEALPDRLADAFILREVQAASAECVCETLGISRENLAARLYRARLLLRTCIGGDAGKRSPTD